MVLAQTPGRSELYCKFRLICVPFSIEQKEGILWHFTSMHTKNDAGLLEFLEALQFFNILSFLGPLWTLNPISVTTFSILSNKSLGECVDVNRIFLWATSCNESMNHKSQVNCSCLAINTQLRMCRYPDMLTGVNEWCWVDYI
jgi:hypothetical protein